MDNSLKQVGCDDKACGFRVIGRDEDELTKVLVDHAKKIHNLDAPKKKVLAKISPASGS